MATSLDEITSERPQPDLSASFPWHCRALSRRLHAYSSFQEGGLLSNHARHLKVRMHPTDEELAEIRDGRDPWRPIEERYDSILHRQQLLRTGSVLASQQHAFVVDENDDGYFPRCIFECETCGQQSPMLQALGGCHGSILPKSRRIPGGHRSGLKSSPAKARPGCLPWPHSCDLAERVYPSEARSRMSDHVFCGEFDGHAREYTAINILGNISGEGTSMMLNPASRDASPSSKFDSIAHEHSDIETGDSRVQSFDQTQQVHSGPRWTILGDSLLDVIVQGPFALVGLKTSNASSPAAKDVLVRVVVIVYAVGFISAFGGKLIGSSKMGGIGSAAAALGFLLTMVVLLL